MVLQLIYHCIAANLPLHGIILWSVNKCIFIQLPLHYNQLFLGLAARWKISVYDHIPNLVIYSKDLGDVYELQLN